MVPDPLKRDAFLRAYLDANYDITVGSGEGILLAIRKDNEDTCGASTLIGGVVFVPPSSDGCGWAIGSDEPYWRAYDKHGLGRISPKGLERVKRYEAWENKHVTQKLSGTRLPMWNGLFCAIAPEHSSKGFGSMVYKGAIKIMAKHWRETQSKAQRVISKSEDTWTENPMQNDEGFMSRFGTKILHGFSLLNHRRLPTGIALAQKKEQPRSAPSDNICKSAVPLVGAISHSDRAANFHAANGFHQMSRIPYYDEVDHVTPFYVHVLVLDPFKTGRLDELNNALKTDINRNLKLYHTPSTVSCSLETS
uniref:Uncharacterized protein LOC100180340 n=1 Tax=Phallusia mammillata TaxID=59560 RepID=A0A6F9DHY9_9ASCI|nr:uncharacterized protein LOC100180340 [Phallusia mammillata]